jgi:hypothetical protein
MTKKVLTDPAHYFVVFFQIAQPQESKEKTELEWISERIKENLNYTIQLSTPKSDT